MRLFMIILVSAIIVIAIYFLIHRSMINRATMMLHKQAKTTTDEAMAYALKQLMDRLPSMPESKLVADVWGKGVLAFEYALKTDQTTGLTPQSLNEQLNIYARIKQIDHLPNVKRTFVVTDWWTYEDILHVDIAYVYNEATREYVADLRKLKNAN